MEVMKTTKNLGQDSRISNQRPPEKKRRANHYKSEDRFLDIATRQIVSSVMGIRFTNYESERIEKETVMAHFKALDQRSHGQTDEILQSG
jgi:hypothetical protein